MTVRPQTKYGMFRRRLERMHARVFPAWLVYYVNGRVVELTAEATGGEVPIPWLVDPRRKDGATLALRYRLIRFLLDEIVQRRRNLPTDDQGKYAGAITEYKRRSDFDDDERLCPRDWGWHPISRPNMAAILGLDQSTITLAIKRMQTIGMSNASA